MFCPQKNSYLQLICAIDPRVINKEVDHGMQKLPLGRSTAPTGTQKIESMQPSIYCPNVDITRCSLGYGRIGLRLINRYLHSQDHMVQLQALHTLMDQIQISEHVMFLIHLNVVYRLIDLIKNDNSIIREKVCLIYTQLAGYNQAREQIATRPIIIENLLWLSLNDIKEIRYVAAFTLWTMSRYDTICKIMLKINNIVPSLLKVTQSEYEEILILHLKTLANLTDLDEEPALRSNGFQIMRKLFHAVNPRLVSAAMNVMANMCKHPVGRKLGDVHSMTWKLRKYLNSPHFEVIIATVRILQYTTLTSASKIRTGELYNDIVKNLVKLSQNSNKPQLQLVCMQVLINLCDSIDIRLYVKTYWGRILKQIKIRTPEQWDGSSGTQDPGLEMGHYYRTVHMLGHESIQSYCDENVDTVSVHSYVKKLYETKDRLIKAINTMSYKSF